VRLLDAAALAEDAIEEAVKLLLTYI
jgi:hypothetical protein